MDILKISGLRKSFGGSEVLKGLNLAVPEHTVYGFIGQNGAGKTTTMKLILGLIKKDAGEILVCGEKAVYGETKTNQYIGYLPDVPEFYGYMTPCEYLKLCGDVTGMKKSDIAARSEELLHMTGLEESRKKRISGFSRGMKQRLGIAQALLNEPKLLICDEPTSALDPIGRREVLEIVRKVKDKTTVLFSTHILSDVEKVCDSAAILNQGEIVMEGSLGEMKAAHMEQAAIIEFRCGEALEQMQRENPGYRMERLAEKELLVRVKNIYKEEPELLRYLASSGLEIEKFEIQEPSLEHLFMEAVQ